VLLASYSAGPAGANGGYYHNKQVDALLAQLQYDGPEKLRSDARRLQDVTTRVDPAMILTDEPAQVSILAHNLHGYVFNPLDLQTFDFYALYRS
jgi:ABC-type transport system substrate-binding protein